MRSHRVCRLIAVAAISCLMSPSVSLAWLSTSDSSVVTVLDTEDTTFDFGTAPLSGAWNDINGASTTLSPSGWFSTAALRFDGMKAYRGQIVQEAELHLAKASSDPNFALAVGTINSDWHENDASWRWRTSSSMDWTFPYSDFSCATFGTYGSLVSFHYSTSGDYGTYSSGGKTWIRARLDPAVAQALVLGDQYGLAVTDPRICYRNRYNSPVYSKEAGSATQPRLLVKFATAPDTTPPDAVGNLTASAGQESGEAILRFAAPTDPQVPTAFGYAVQFSSGSDIRAALSIDRWRIPRPRTPGTLQRVLIQNLTPGATYTFFVQAYDAAGNISSAQSVTFAIPSTVATPALADGTFVTPDPTNKSIRSVPNVLRYWVASEVAKTNPVTGNRIEDGYGGTAADNYKKANAVWDAGTNTISLQTCRNEVVGAQLVLEKLGATLSNVHVAVSDLTSPSGGTIPASTSAELFLLHYVQSGSNYYADAAIPLAAPFPTSFAIPNPDHNPSASAKNQSVWMDLYVPATQPRGTYTGTVTVTASELSSPVTISLKVRVANITIPDYPTFLVDLNGYGNPWDYPSTEASKDRTCLRYFQAAHKHRAMCNTLAYGWSATVWPARGPTLTGAGPTLHAADWSAFDSRFGRFFDGSAFTPTTPDSPYYGPGTNTPVTHLYTCFCESWPIHLHDTLYGFDAAGKGGAYWDNLFDSGDYLSFFTDMPDVYPGFPDGYKQGVRNVVADWFLHAHNKGWTRTNFEIFLNNKDYYIEYANCAALWILEECESADDFRAVGFLHQLYREGQAQSGVTDVPWHFRIDGSTRWCQHWGQLDGRINIQDLSSAASSWHWPQMKYRNFYLDEDKQEQWMWYGLGSAITSPGTDLSRTLLQQWSQGMAGGLPYWDNYQTSWGSANDLSVMYSGQNVPGFGLYEGAIVSTRLKMMRQAEQIIELANLWAGQPGVNKPLVRNSIYNKYKGGSGTWDYAFGSWDENAVYRLRSDLIAQLDSQLLLPGDINGDGYVNVGDLQILVASWGRTLGEPGYDSRADLDGNHTINVGDLQVLVANWGRSQ